MTTARQAIASSHRTMPKKPKAKPVKREPLGPIPWPPKALQLAEKFGVNLPRPRRFILSVTVPIKTVSEMNSRAHHMVKAKRAAQQKELVMAVLSECLVTNALELPEAPTEMVVVLTRIAPGTLDVADNLPSSMKHTIDAIAHVLGVDDGDRRVRYEFDQRKGKAKEYAVRIDLLEVGL